MSCGGAPGGDRAAVLLAATLCKSWLLKDDTGADPPASHALCSCAPAAASGALAGQGLRNLPARPAAGTVKHWFFLSHLTER